MRGRRGLAYAVALGLLTCCGGSGGGSTIDAGPDAAIDAAPDAAVLDDSCNSLFAVRIRELQQELDATFPSDCDTPLRDPVGTLDGAGAKQCAAGETANACRDRLFATPPPITALQPGCRNGTTLPSGCLAGKWLPPCSDGTTTCGQPDAVCQDGTRAMVYLEASQTTPSDAWVFYLGGEGKPCYGTVCWLDYRFGIESGAGAAYERAMSSMHPDHVVVGAITGSGIVYGDPAGPAAHAFVGYNRVKFNRCSDTASDAIEVVPIFDANRRQTGTAPVWHHGLAIWSATFRSLATPAGRDLDGDGVPDLPSLAAANVVVLSASSDATLWLIHAADDLRVVLRSIAGPGVDVRIVLDGYFDPMLDNEARYGSNPPPNFNMFDQPYTVTQRCVLPDNGDSQANEACSDQGYTLTTHPTGEVSMKGALVTRGSHLDRSCETAHGAGAPPCYDKLHVLFHHVSTPFMVIADQEDSTVPKLPPDHADVPSYRYAGPGVWRQRVLDQAHDVAAYWATASREEGPGTPGDAAMVLRKQRRNGEPWSASLHTHLGSDVSFARTMTRCTSAGAPIVTASLAQTVDAWLAGTLPVYLIAEDGDAWGGVGDYFVTGSACRTPE